MKKINKYIEQFLLKEDKINDRDKSQSFSLFIGGKKQFSKNINFSEADSIFKEFSGLNFEIFNKKINLMEKKFIQSVENSKFHHFVKFKNGFDKLEIFYFKNSKIDLKKPDMIAFDYYFYKIFIKMSKVEYSFFYEENFKPAWSDRYKQNFYFDRSFNIDNLIFEFLKFNLEKDFKSILSTPINNENINEYVSLSKIVEYV